MTKKILVLVLSLAVVLPLGACQQYMSRSDLIDESGGDAIARNNVHQIIDPWNPNAYNTDIPANSEKQVKAYERYIGADNSKSEVDAPSTK